MDDLKQETEAWSMTALRIAAAGLLGYLLGSLSSAVVVSFVISRKDVRNYGSGNAGATNMARLFGMGTGVLTFLLDGAKTVAAMALGRLIGGYGGFLLAAFTCLLGHCFPLYFGFRGGTGVSVGAAIGLMLHWKVFVIIVAVFFITFFITRRVSAGSVMCAVAFLPAELIAGFRDAPALLLGLAAGALVLFMHRENIKRLLRGEEKPFRPGRVRLKRGKKK